MLFFTNVFHLSSTIRYAYPLRSNSVPRRHVSGTRLSELDIIQDYLSVNNTHLLMSAQSMYNEPALTQTPTPSHIFTPHFPVMSHTSCLALIIHVMCDSVHTEFFPLNSQRCLFLPSHYSPICSVNSCQVLQSSLLLFRYNWLTASEMALAKASAYVLKSSNISHVIFSYLKKKLQCKHKTSASIILS